MSHFVFYLVHGTQFYLFKKPAVPWVTDDKEPLRKGLREALHGHCVDFVKVPWSGRNRQRARLEAADKLKQCIEERQAGASHEFIIAHSHGGNAAIRALGGTAERVEGVACLSTPFLTFSDRQKRLQAGVTLWMAAVLLATAAIAGTLSNEAGAWSILVIAVTVLATMIVLAVLYALVRVLASRVDPARLPPVKTPLFLAHAPGDEASGALGAVSLAAAMSTRMESVLERGLQFFSRYRNIVLSALVLAALLTLVSLLGGGPLALWGLGVLAALALVSLPLRLTILGLAYGLDLIPVGVLYEVAAAPTPPGPYETGQFRMMMLDWPREEHDESFAHSRTYQHPEVIAALADWVVDIAGRQQVAAIE